MLASLYSHVAIHAFRPEHNIILIYKPRVVAQHLVRLPLKITWLQRLSLDVQTQADLFDSLRWRVSLA